MMHWSSSAGRVAFIVVAVLSAAAATPTAAQQAPQPAAQQPAGPGATDEARAAQTNAPSAPLPGPRLSPEFPRVQPSIAARRAPGPVPPAQNTIVISTLALVLIVVIVTILVVK